MLSDDERYILHTMDRLLTRAHKNGRRVVRFLVQQDAWSRLQRNIRANLVPEHPEFSDVRFKDVVVEFHNGNARKIYFQDESKAGPITVDA